MGNYRLRKEAEDNLIRIHQRGVRDHGATQADKYYEAFFDRFEQLAEQPYLYQAVEHIQAGYRQSVCGKDSIYYRIEKDGVEIIRVLGQQDPETRLRG